MEAGTVNGHHYYQTAYFAIEDPESPPVRHLTSEGKLCIQKMAFRCVRALRSHCSR